MIAKVGDEQYDEYVSWWLGRKPEVKASIFSKYIVVTPGVCGFSLFTDPMNQAAYFTWMVGNREQKAKVVYNGFVSCIREGRDFCKRINIHTIFCATSTKSLSRLFQKEGFLVGDVNSTEMFLVQ